MSRQMDLLKETVFKCRRCGLNITKKNYVFGAGNEKSQIMFIGSVPTSTEDKQGIPFIGRSGKMLDEILDSLNLSRDDIYICNILKCHPPHNRSPEKDEIMLCSSYLNKQIDIIRPKIICPLGSVATTYIMNRYGLNQHGSKITLLHGKVFRVSTTIGETYIIPLYHPGMANYNIDMKKIIIDDLRVVLDVASQQMKERK